MCGVVRSFLGIVVALLTQDVIASFLSPGVLNVAQRYSPALLLPSSWYRASSSNAVSDNGISFA